MKVKFCGITRPEDVRACAKVNADLIGFINIERSKRFVSLDKINELTSLMENKKKAILVIEPEDLKEAETTIRKSAINTVQLHSLSSEDIIKLRHGFLMKQDDELKMSLNIIKAIGIPETITAPKRMEIENFAMVSDFLLFDYEIDGKSGGTGRQIPLELALEATKIAKNANYDIKLFLAGGMNSEQIKNRVKLIDEIFDYIDINSGVEDQPGLKNPEKIRELMQIVKDINDIQK